MKKINRGKDWERIVQDALTKCGAVVRIPDQMTMMKQTSQNFCDFLFYQLPYLTLIEAKSVYGDRFDFSRITENQLNGMYDMYTNHKGIGGYVLVWFIDHDAVYSIPIQEVKQALSNGVKSINIKNIHKYRMIRPVTCTKKRVLVELDEVSLMEVLKHG